MWGQIYGPQHGARHMKTEHGRDVHLQPDFAPEIMASSDKPMSSIRQQKVERLVQRTLSEIFQQESHNIFGGAFITVTVVRISPDLGHAKVYLSFFQPGDKSDLLAMVNAQNGRVRGMLGHRIGKSVRVVPELQFHIDDSLDQSEKIDELLKK